MPKKLKSNALKTILLLSKQGASYTEIGEKVGCNSRTVAKVVKENEEKEYGIRSDVYSQLSDFAYSIGCEVEDILIGLMQEHDCWGFNTRPHTKELKRRKISELDSSVLRRFIQMSKEMDADPNDIITNEIQKYM
jgi:hypothetical protein